MESNENPNGKTIKQTNDRNIDFAQLRYLYDPDSVLLWATKVVEVTLLENDPFRYLTYYSILFVWSPKKNQHPKWFGGK